MSKRLLKNATTRRGKSNQMPKAEVTTGDKMPTAGGRVSEPTGYVGLYSGLRMMADQVSPNFDIELLKVCNWLAIHNNDVSYAVDNIVQLGSTPHTIIFDDDVSDEEAKEMANYLTSACDSLYRGGVNSLKNDLLVQAYVTGSFSVEAIPAKNLKRIDRVVLVPPSTIRFKYNPKTYDYDPYQTISNSIVGNNVGLDNLIKLNPTTYKYYSLRTMDGNPTAIPPLIAALDMIQVEAAMLENMQHIIRKIGLFGFLTVMLKAPMRKQGQDEAAYYAASKQYLNMVRPDIEKGFAEGVVLGFEGAHKFEVEGNNTNIDGFHQIMELVTTMKMSGMKQDPLMLGRNFNVAETMARVILVKLTSQIANYQQLLGSILADLFRLMLVMAGRQVKPFVVELQRSVLSDALKDEQAYKQKIENRKTLRDTGVISQQAYALEVGYDNPHAKKDVDYSVPKAEKAPTKDPRVNTDPRPDKDQADDPTGIPTTDYEYASILVQYTRNKPEFDYCKTCRCASITSFDRVTDIVNEMVIEYLERSHEVYSESSNRIAEYIVADLRTNGKGSTPSEMADRIMYMLYTRWGQEYSLNQDNVVLEYVPKIFAELVKDHSDSTKQMFFLFMLQVSNYFVSSDQYFFGRFITDADTRRRIRNYSMDAFDESSFDAIQAGLTGTLEDEAWKIDRIGNTTLSKLQNIAGLMQMIGDNTTKFTLVSVKDSKRCNYCAAMDGKTFSVTSAMDKVKEMIAGAPSDVGSYAPFITTLLKGRNSEDIARMTGEELQELGFLGFTPHANCRCKIVKQ